MTASTRLLRLEPVALGDGLYAKVLKDPELLTPRLAIDKRAKWHNPDGQHFTIEVDPENGWYLAELRGGTLKIAADEKPRSRTKAGADEET